MYKYVLNLVIKISLMFAQYFEYYAIILRGPVFCGHSVYIYTCMCVCVSLCSVIAQRTLLRKRYAAVQSVVGRNVEKQLKCGLYISDWL